jgi:AcrR family transcriptional regulator
MSEERPDRRRELVDAAYGRIARDGFEGLRTRDVAADVGLNIATLHYYFPTKEALIRGVIGRAMQRFYETLPADGTALDRLRGHLAALHRLMKDDTELWAVMGELVVRAPRDANLGDIFRQTDDHWLRTLRDMLARCIDDGSIDSTLDADETAALLMVALKGLSLPTASGFRPELADQVFRQIERLLGLPTGA